MARSLYVKTLDALVAEISRLNVTIQKLTEMLFGKKSEKLPKDKPSEESESVETSNEEISDATKSPETPENSVPTNFTGTPRKKKKKKNGGGGRMKIPDNLPVTIIEIHPPPEERTCTECQEEFKRIGKSVSKRIVFKPSSFEVEETWTFAYAAECPCSDGKIAKPEPDVQPIDKGLASISLLAIIAIMKFADHLPLARQSSRIFKRSGLNFSQSSMCRWMRKIADLLEPLYDLICDEVLLSFCMQIDATFVKCRDENGKTSLHLALRSGHEKIVRLLVEAGADMHAVDTNDWTPLHEATNQPGQLHVLDEALT